MVEQNVANVQVAGSSPVARTNLTWWLMKVTASQMKKFHLVMMTLWIILLIPSVIWWKDSILWVIFLSIYANFVGHLSGYSGARAERANEK